MRPSMKVAADCILKAGIHSQFYTFLSSQDQFITMRRQALLQPVSQNTKTRCPAWSTTRSLPGSTCSPEPLAIVKLLTMSTELEIQEQKENRAVRASPMSNPGLAAEELQDEYGTAGTAGFHLCSSRAGTPLQVQRACIPIVEDISISGRTPCTKPPDDVPIIIWLGGDFRRLIVVRPSHRAARPFLKQLGSSSSLGQSGSYTSQPVGKDRTSGVDGICSVEMGRHWAEPSSFPRHAKCPQSHF